MKDEKDNVLIMYNKETGNNGVDHYKNGSISHTNEYVTWLENKVRDLDFQRNQLVMLISSMESKEGTNGLQYPI